MRPPDAVLFDFDFTLGDSSAGICDAANWALCAMGLAPASDDLIRPLIGRTLPEMFASITGVRNAGEGQEFKRLFLARADETMTGMTRIYGESHAAVLALRARGARTGIVSTKVRRRIEAILHAAQMTTLFDLVVGLEDVIAPKPDPAGLLLAMERLGAAPERTVYVGDHEVDAEAAQRAGVRFVGVETGVRGAAGFGRDVVCIPTLGELDRALRAVWD